MCTDAALAWRFGSVGMRLYQYRKMRRGKREEDRRIAAGIPLLLYPVKLSLKLWWGTGSDTRAKGTVEHMKLLLYVNGRQSRIQPGHVQSPHPVLKTLAADRADV